MGISRQTNFLGQMRVDVPHLKAIESAVANDFDLLAGKMLSGKMPLIIKGFTVGTANTVGALVDNLQLNVAGGLLMHYGASEAGTIFGASDTAAAQTLNGLNANVYGSFTAGATNYIGLDLFRAPDTATSDLVQFYDANTDQEVPQTVPLARTLQYKIVISTQNFTVSSNIVPIAKVITSSSNTVVSITDARRLMFRLGSGGDNPSATYAYPWGTRTENNIIFTGSGDSFTGEDKSITSLKGWLDMAMTTIWEAKGGQTWYSPVNRDNVKLANGQPVLATGDNFFFPLYTITAGNATRAAGVVTVTSVAHQFINGQVIDVNTPIADPDFPPGTKVVTGVAANSFTYAEAGANVSNAQTLKISSLMWDGLSLVFENSTAWTNPIAASASTGVAVPDGGCLYVDLVRENNSTVTAAVAPLLTAGYSVIPGRRMILAWRSGDYMYAKDRPFEIGRFLNPVATNLALGIVKLNQVAGAPAAPVVVSIMANGRIAVAATGGNVNAATFDGNGSGAGVYATGGATAGSSGVIGNGVGAGGEGVIGIASGSVSGSNGGGVHGFGSGNSPGVRGDGGATGSGVVGVGGITSGFGGLFSSAAANQSALFALGSGTGHGVIGTGGAGAGSYGGSFGNSAANGNGVKGAGAGTGIGGVFESGSGATGDGATGTALSTNGNGFFGTGNGTGSGIKGQGGAGGYGGVFVGGNGGATSFGIHVTGGSAGATGAYILGGAGGLGLYVDAGAGNMGAIFAAATGSGVGLTANGGTTGVGIIGTGGSTAPGADGVRGISGTTATVLAVNGVLGTGTGSGTGVKGISTNGYGMVAESDTTTPTTAAFRIVPQDADPTGPALVGDMYVTTAGKLKICTTAGTPGVFTIVGTQV